MKTALHLLSMPIHDPLQPSCQLGYLQAYVEQAFGEQIPVQAHSAHAEIVLHGNGLLDIYSRHRLFGEELFFLVCAYSMPRLERMFDRALDLYNAAHPDLLVSRSTVASLSSAVADYIDTKFAPSLRPDRLNVIGMTTTFTQLFASILAVHHIRRRTYGPMLFVLGGASMSLPEATRTLELWDVDALLVSGSGEAPLTAILQACIELSTEAAHDAVSDIDRRNFINVIRAGSPAKAIDLTLSKDFLSTVPDPVYDEFFASLRALCDSDAVYQEALQRFVAIPLEGSRGCFARCDFCQNPDITSQFRTLKGGAVGERALRLSDQYGTRRVYFADSVCNSWANEYADHLLDRGRDIGAFMEMRVHAPERLWAKLALAGVEEVQLGIEALSEPLLRAINKGTTVMQNLSASKYLAELGIKSLSNLITHHPKSTVADVERTMAIARLIEHFPSFCLSRFVVSYASPIYRDLGEERRAALIQGFNWLPPELRGYSFPRDLAYSYAPEWLDPAVAAAWDRFREWYAEHLRTLARHKAVFAAERRGPGEIAVSDSRFGRSLRYSLKGDRARVFALCHEPLRPVQIEERTGLDANTVVSILSEFVDAAMLVEDGDRYLTVALRPAEELLENSWRGMNKPENREADSAVRWAIPHR